MNGMGQPNVRRVVFIIVNAQGKASDEWSREGKLAAIPRVVSISSSVLLTSYTYETVELLRNYIREWSAEEAASGTETPLEFYVIEVIFDALSDDECQFFSNIPTTLTLPRTTVDKLLEAGKRILYESEDFKRLVHDLGAEIPPPVDNPAPLVESDKKKVWIPRLDLW